MKGPQPKALASSKAKPATAAGGANKLKRNLPETNEKNSNCQASESNKRVRQDPNELPPLPDDFLNFFDEKDKAWKDDPAQHDGRVRSKPHVEGNWATVVYVSFLPSAELEDLVEQIRTKLGKRLYPQHTLTPIYEDLLHISLSRTAFLKVFQIDRFVELLGEKVSQLQRFHVTFNGFSQYLNDDETRSFLGADVEQGKDQVPKFHASIASAPTVAITPKMAKKINKEFEAGLKDIMVPITGVQCKIGNKSYSWQFK
ncbi:poly(U)-specific 3'-to-5' RNA exonuclease [Rhizophlyctis rosea]|uniref:U6 snRNA phosphodiesterase 1 n=1 Tax=Rhizophlyctis rosea TaxID=64517 RepID=A0AAD5SJF9_9FUNG|nr:poly(U)-specific 3'-to-5' RNA exonuclease [Rhizophlyctis rosea]